MGRLDDGLVHVSRDAGKTWTNVTPKDLPEWSMISQVDPSPHHAGTMFVAANRYKLDDRRPFLYQTTDYGQTWKRLSDGLPKGAFTRVVRQDPCARRSSTPARSSAPTCRSTAGRAGSR